ncbi:MAG: B-box zinc finger protein [Candidatus Korobacteraceae bacterium]
MNCANHADVPAVAYCRTCGKPLCSTCARDVRGVVYCEECLASHLSGVLPPPGSAAMPPGAVPPTGMPSPKVAAILGFIPGVGAMYNGEFAKGFIHVLVFATLIWLANPDHGSGLFGLAIAAFAIYMPIEAYQTAKAREMGLPPPDPFGFNHLFGSGSPSARPASGAPANVVPPEDNPPGTPGLTEPLNEPHSRVPVGAVILIGLGVLFLLDEMGALHFDWIWRFWPLILIAIGIRVLMQRQRRGW